MVFGGENAESYYDEGVTAAMKGDVKRAVSCFEQAIRMDNSMASAYHQLGKCYYRLGEHQKAVKLLQQVVGHKPDATIAKLDLGYALIHSGDTTAARQQFESIMASEPAHGRGMLGMANVCFHDGDWSGAMSYAQNAVNFGGANFAALYLLGRAARLAGDITLSENALDRADKLIEKSIEMNPDNPEGYYLRGEVMFARDKFGDALDNFRAAEERMDGGKIYAAFGENFARADVLVKQGLCYQRLGRVDRAREMGKAVLEIDGDHKLGKALSQLEKSEDAG